MSCKSKTEGSFSSVIVIHFDGTCIILVAPLVPLVALMFSWYKDVLKELLTLLFLNFQLLYGLLFLFYYADILVTPGCCQ